MTSRKIVKFMIITREANMTFTHNLITHLNFKKVWCIWMSDCTNNCPGGLKTDKYNRFRKEVKSTLLKTTVYSLEEYLRTTLETPLGVTHNQEL